MADRIEKIYNTVVVNNIKRNLLLFLVLFAFVPVSSSAHQPRITESGRSFVSDPEISKAYYGKLTGESDVYVINASAPFELYINILVPDIAGQKKDVSVAIIKNGDTTNPLAVLDGPNFEWKQFYEPFGADSYWMGPEYKASVEAGTYEIRVWSSNNDSKYALAVGEVELFNVKESMNALTLIPQIKKNFFDESPFGFIRSPMSWVFIAVMYIIAGVVGLLYRTVLKRVAKNSPRGVTKNIGKNDRLLRFAIGVALLLLAMTTTWSPTLIFFSGFCFFEAIFSWCGLYAAIGKSTCPINT